MTPSLLSRRPVTDLLHAWANGELDARDDLLPLVYQELRRRAAAQLRRERRGHTLQPTALVHEAYLRLANQRRVDWRSRVHFFALASSIMRRILVDYARARAAGRRPDEALRVPLESHLATCEARNCDLLLLDRVLNELAHLDPRQAYLVQLVYFGGLSETEAGEVVSASRSTVARELRSAKAWLYRRMTMREANARRECR